MNGFVWIAIGLILILAGVIGSLAWGGNSDD